MDVGMITLVVFGMLFPLARKHIHPLLESLRDLECAGVR
jgi:hypothetical protein